MTPRPVPKDVLKKMFLKVLLEHKRPGGKYTSNGASVCGILDSTLPFHFGLKNEVKHLRKQDIPWIRKW